MLISEFARQAGLSVDTVRFYIRKGLIEPETNGLGGRHPYQLFTEDHLATARMIRMSQSLGMSLKEIAAIDAERREGRMTGERTLEIMADQLARLERRAEELQTVRLYLRAKIAWMKAGEIGEKPAFPMLDCDDCGCSESGNPRAAGNGREHAPLLE